MAEESPVGNDGLYGSFTEGMTSGKFPPVFVYLFQHFKLRKMKELYPLSYLKNPLTKLG